MPLTAVFCRNSKVLATDRLTLDQLATELGVAVERLSPLIEHGYLTLLESAEYLKDCIVARPLPLGLECLRTMLGPIHVQPLFTIAMVAEILRSTPENVRELCIVHSVPFKLDPAFGELLTLQDFHVLYRHVYSFKSPARFDMLAIYYLSRVGNPKLLKPYSVRVDKEVRRILKLPEPQRSMRAIAMIEAYEGAKDLADVMKRYRNTMSHSRDELAARIKELKERVFRVKSGPASSDPDGESS